MGVVRTGQRRSRAAMQIGAHWRRLAVWCGMALALLLPFLEVPAARADGAPWTTMAITAFCDNGPMADGNWVHDGAIAAGWDIPFGSLVEIDGLGVFVVEDRGSAILPGRIDVWLPSCGAAIDFGRQWRAARVQRWGWWGE